MKCKHCGADIAKYTNPDGWGALKITGIRERDFGCPVMNRHEPEGSDA